MAAADVGVDEEADVVGDVVLAHVNDAVENILRVTHVKDPWIHVTLGPCHPWMQVGLLERS